MEDGILILAFKIVSMMILLNAFNSQKFYHLQFYKLSFIQI